MKISEYADVTVGYEAEFEKLLARVRNDESPAVDLIRLFDVIETRRLDVLMWLSTGRTWEDSVPNHLSEETK